MSNGQALPPILITNAANQQVQNSRKNFTNRNATIGVGNTSAFLFHSINPGVQSVDDKLHEQFRYFKAEYLETSNSSGLAVPAIMTEDKSGQIYKFVQNGGPKYLFEVIDSNMENIQLLRCSLSLLVIIITVLRRRLPQPDAKDSPDSVTAWVIDTLAKIGDNSAVTVCIGVLISSYNPSVQELSLSLLASLLAVSDEGVVAMLQASNVDGSNIMGTKDRNSSSISPKRINNRASAGMEQNENTQLGSNNLNCSNSRQERRKERDLKSDIKKLNFTFNTMDYSFKKSKPKEKQIRRNCNNSDNRPNSCLAYVLSIVLLQKNRHLLAAGCADVIIAMLQKNTTAMAEAIAQTATCELPSIDHRKSKGGENKSGGGGGVSMSKYSFNPKPEDDPLPPSNPLGNVIIEWAGLKLLLKFLFRYEKMILQSTKTNASLPLDSVSACLRLREEYCYAHDRVFYAICQLIAASPVVAAYANALPGAEELIILTSQNCVNMDSNVTSSYNACLRAIQLDKQYQRRLRAAAQAKRKGISLSAATSPTEAVAAGGYHITNTTAIDMLTNSNNNMPFTPIAGSNGDNVAAGATAATRATMAATARSWEPPSNKIRDEHEGHNNNNTSNKLTKPTLSTSPNRRQSKENNKAITNNSNSLNYTTKDRMIGTSAPRIETQTGTVALANNITMDFSVQYQVATEQKGLYLLNAYDAKYGQHSANNASSQARGPVTTAAAELRSQSLEVQRRTPKTPLSYNPTADALLDNSLENMGFATLRPISATRRLSKSSGSSDNNSQHHYYDNNTTQQQIDRSNCNTPSHSRRRKSVGSSSDGDNQQLLQDNCGDTNADASTYASSSVSQLQGYNNNSNNRNEDNDDYDAYGLPRVKSVQKDFFDRLPMKPAVPIRIEAKDAIMQGEDLSRIRKKFQAIADQAARRAGHGNASVSRKKNRNKYGKVAIGNAAAHLDVMNVIYGPKKFSLNGDSSPLRRLQDCRSDSPSAAVTALAPVYNPDGTRALTQSRGGLRPVDERELFGSFMDAAAVAIQDLSAFPTYSPHQQRRANNNSSSSSSSSNGGGNSRNKAHVEPGNENDNTITTTVVPLRRKSFSGTGNNSNNSSYARNITSSPGNFINSNSSSMNYSYKADDDDDFDNNNNDDDNNNYDDNKDVSTSDVCGLRLETFEFDFESFQPIFAPAREPPQSANSATTAELQQSSSTTTKENRENISSIGNRTKLNLEMTQTVDLILR